jgi:hypothetical protein
LDQHLRGPHKQTSVARVRRTGTTPPSMSNRVAISTGSKVISQSNRQKQGNSEDIDESEVARLKRELAEERELQEQLDDYKGRLDKYEQQDKVPTF